MAKLVIVSNRLPVQLIFDNEDLKVIPSVGGLATGMKSVYKTREGIWIGWSGTPEEHIDDSQKSLITKKLESENCVPVYLSEDELDGFYYGFSNRTIWPLFHYFTEFTEYDNEHWEIYKKVNQKFADVILDHLDDNDYLWIHDYQLLLLPELIKKKKPDVNIGFFLHIPFPSYEVFRILPWREEIIKGMLGADLLGFHTYDYQRHFYSTVRRLLGHEIHFNEIKHEADQISLVDAFPMGIDFDRFYNTSNKHNQQSIRDKSKVQQELDKHLLTMPGVKLVLSIDRLDYTKGIANRLKAFENFLFKYPEFVGKVSLVMLCVPSRSTVEQYQIMKSEVDELVGRINGEFSTIEWTPIWYFYRSMPFDNLIDLYKTCEVALLTPIRDGMNLVAKEYVASKVDKQGVLILSEMAGASKEMSEAIVINPNNLDEIADALKEALEMPVEEQVDKMTVMQERLKRYDVKKWANDFIETLEKTTIIKEKYHAKRIGKKETESILELYKKAKKRILFFDYDGTLVGFKPRPELAKPTKELYEILDALSNDSKNKLNLISGRDKGTFSKWFGDRGYDLVCEHGVWFKDTENDWHLLEQYNVDWKDLIRHQLEFYVDRTPGSFIEEKSFSLAWHYRKSDPELGNIRANELKDELTSIVANHSIEILEGKKVIEIKNSGINKGRAAMAKLSDDEYDFILCVGDDWTDEYMFEALPEPAITIKVGLGQTQAKYSIEKQENVLELIKKLTFV